MKKKKMRLKGKLRLYMNWPLIMTFLLVAMNIWVLMVDRKAAFIMFMFILIYLAIAGGLYFYNRSLILADLIQFSTQYKGIENTLLKELAVPYAIALEDGRILWKNDAFSKLTQSSRKEKYLYRMIPALTTSVFPKDDMEHVEMEAILACTGRSKSRWMSWKDLGSDTKCAPASALFARQQLRSMQNIHFREFHSRL